MAWYHDYFKGLPQRAWKLHQDEEQTYFEVDFLTDVLEINQESRVLDLLSGYGRHAVPVAENGCEVTCIDISEEYCDELKSVVAENGLNIHVVCGDVLEQAFESGAFDAAYCLGNSFSFFPRREMQQLIINVAKALKTGGYFVIHTENLAESILPNFQVRNWMPVGEDIMYLAENDYQPAEGYILSEQTFISGTEKIVHSVKQHIYTLAELIFMFENAGFEVTGTFSDIEANHFTLGDEHVYLLARKI